MEKELKDELLNQLVSVCHELEEFGDARAISIDQESKEVIIGIRYSDPENNGDITIFGNY